MSDRKEVVESIVLGVAHGRASALPNKKFSFAELLGVLRSVLEDGRIDQGDKPVLTKAMQSAFDKYVRDYDIPFIPNVIEPWVDDALYAAIPAIVGAALNSILPQAVEAPKGFPPMGS